MTKLLDTHMDAIEDQINNHVINKVKLLDQNYRELSHVDTKLDKHIGFVKDSFEKLHLT